MMTTTMMMMMMMTVMMVVTEMKKMMINSGFPFRGAEFLSGSEMPTLQRRQSELCMFTVSETKAVMGSVSCSY